ncbi:MAG TPA: dihydrolipoamide acetyltransferase family protein [Nocardioidaceae bacterium]|nr:dihydrolipoamide acetyltransferase family protein [Nocardioidaceae bacterium]
MSANQFKLPDVGEGLTEAEVVTWMVKPGDSVKVNDIVCEIETAKSLVELPSPYAGTVAELLVAEGETVAVGTPIITIYSGDGAAAAPAPATADAPAGQASSTATPPGAAEGRSDEPAPTATLVGYGPRESTSKRRPRKPRDVPAGSAGARQVREQVQDTFSLADQTAGTSAPTQADSSIPTPSSPSDEPVPPAAGPAAASPAARPAPPAAVLVLAKPPVRKLAKDLGVDLTQVRPTGPGGTITRDDVQASVAGDTATATSTARASVDRETYLPVKGVRRATAAAMVASAFTAPHVTEWVTLDATATMELVARLRERREFHGVKVSPLLVVARAVCLTVRRTPEVNATWDEPGQRIVLKHYVNLGIAAATPRGLVVPNIKGADAMTALDLAHSIAELTATAREGRSQPAEMTGGTFTITNVGVFGVDSGTPIINPGETAILAMGMIRKQPWVVDDRVEPRWVTTLALSFDHRVVDGEQGSRFLADVASIVADPANALLF